MGSFFDRKTFELLANLQHTPSINIQPHHRSPKHDHPYVPPLSSPTPSSPSKNNQTNTTPPPLPPQQHNTSSPPPPATPFPRSNSRPRRCACSSRPGTRTSTCTTPARAAVGCCERTSTARRFWMCVLGMERRGKRRRIRGVWIGMLGREFFFIARKEGGRGSLRSLLVLTGFFQYRPDYGRTNGVVVSFCGREIGRLQSRTQTPRLRCLGLHPAHPPPALSLHPCLQYRSPLQTLFCFPYLHETRRRYGFPRPPHLRPRNPRLHFRLRDDFPYH